MENKTRRRGNPYPPKRIRLKIEGRKKINGYYSFYFHLFFFSFKISKLSENTSRLLLFLTEISRF